MPKISVVVPVYNTQEYLKECLDSLVNQTLKDIEIIIVNDCSPDNSLEIIKSYKDKRIKLINHKKNMGIGKTRNDGIKEATGEYITFLDSDDYLDITMLEQYYNFAKTNNLDIVTGHYIKVFDEDGIEKLFKSPTFNFNSLDGDSTIINKIEYGPWCKIYLKEIIDKNNIRFNEELKFEDVPFVMEALLYAKKIGHIDKALCYYRIRSNSETTTVDKRTKDIFGIIKIINKIYAGKYREEIEYFNIVQTTRYMLKQRYQVDQKEKNEIIEYGYNHLDNNFPNWKKNSYYIKENILKRIIKNNKFLLKLYILFRRRK